MMLADNKIEPNMMIKLKIANKTIEALLDTGSPYTLIDVQIYKYLRLPRWTNLTVPLRGFAGPQRKSLGQIKVNVKINSLSLSLECQVVADGQMSFNMVLGRNILEQANVFIEDGIPLIEERAQPDAVHELMMIQTDDAHTAIQQLECITEIHDPHMRQEVLELVQAYKPAHIAESCIKMVILMEDKIPTYQHPRRLSQMERDVVQTIIGEWLDEGIVRPSRSEYASPILLRKKKNGLYRLCVDYRKLNMKVTKDRYPLPIMEDVIDALVNRIFSR